MRSACVAALERSPAGPLIASPRSGWFDSRFSALSLESLGIGGGQTANIAVCGRRSANSANVNGQAAGIDVYAVRLKALAYALESVPVIESRFDVRPKRPDLRSLGRWLFLAQRREAGTSRSGGISP